MANQVYDPLASVQAAGPPGTISFIYGLPDPATFPVEGLRRSADQVLNERAELALQYGPEQGYGPLIDYLRRKLNCEEDLVLDRSQIMLTGGSSQALDHLCTLFTSPGDVLLVEAPTYHETIQILRDHGLRPLQVPTDRDGLLPHALADRLDALTREGDRARILYTIPNFQNPSGTTLSLDRRQEIMSLVQRYDILVIEDDVYRDLDYEGRVPPSLFSLDGGKQTLRIGSFSKILAPGVRLGWLMGHENLIGTLIDSGLRRMGGGANPFVANILASYCLAGWLEPHIQVLRQTYLERRDAMLSALDEHMPDGVEWTQPGGGFFVWLTLPPPLRATEVAARAQDAKLLVQVGDPFFAEMPTGQHLRLAFSYVSPEKIRTGIRMLGQVLRDS